MIDRIVVLCHPENRRARFFTDACARLALPAPMLIEHADWISGRCDLFELLSPHTLLRIESPGESLTTQRLLLGLGAAHPRATCPQDVALAWEPEHGEIVHSAQRFYGWRAALLKLDAIVTSSACHAMSRPLDVIDMFDKARTCERLLPHDIAMPERLPSPTSYDALRAIMRAHDAPRVFLKPRFGSSASGVVALASSSTQIQATTSAQLVRRHGRITLYNSLRIQRYTDHADVVALIDRLTEEPVVLERWVPKASVRRENVDIRIVVIGGEAHHLLGRRSASPMTNLHLGNARCLRDELVTTFGEEPLAAACALASRAMTRGFPDTSYAGLDVMLTAGSLEPRVIEVNAFGDLLPNLLVDGEDTYTTALRCALARFTS